MDIFSYFSMKKNVAATHQKHLHETRLMSTQNIYFYGELEKIILKVSSNTPP